MFLRKWISVLLACCMLCGCASAEWQDAGILVRDGINLGLCCDSSVLWYAFSDTDTAEGKLDYIAWLVDRVTNQIVPGAVEKLMLVPAFGKAVNEGLISRYMTLGLTYDDHNQFGARMSGAMVGGDGQGIHSIEDAVVSQAYQMVINLYIFGEDVREDDEKQRELESAVLHEMVHAFMYDYNRNAMNGMDKDGKREMGTDEVGEEICINAMPYWMGEGFAISVQDGFTQRHKELLDFFGEDESLEEYLAILQDREVMTSYLELFSGGTMFSASLKDTGNAYNLSYVACMYLYSMAAEAMEIPSTYQDGDITRLDKEALLTGMDLILTALHEGKSMSEILQIISQDPQTGEPRYTDIGDFEEKCFRGADEPGLIFWQTMMLDFLDRSREPEEYLESGSVLPGFDNGFEHYLSQERAESCPAFQVVFCPEADAENAYYALSTVQPSRLALGGGMVLSYDPETDALTEEEAAAKDRLFIGDQVRYLMIPEEE